MIFNRILREGGSFSESFILSYILRPNRHLGAGNSEILEKGLTMRRVSVHSIERNGFGRGDGMKKTVNWRAFYVAAVILYALGGVAIGLYTAFMPGETRGFMGFAGLLFLPIPWLIRVVFRLKPAYLADICLLAFIFAAFELGVAFSWYSKYAYYDLLAHGVSGVIFTAVGLCAYYLFREDKHAPMGKDRLVSVSFAAFFSMTAAGMWEIVEYVIYLVFGNDSQYAVAPYAGFNGVADTMEDMMICLAGTAVMCLFLWIHLGGRRLSVLAPIDQFVRVNWGNEAEDRASEPTAAVPE